MKTFLQEIKESFPKNIKMPAEIEAMFLWLEEKGYIHKYLCFDERFANFYPYHLIDNGGAFAQFIKVEGDYWNDLPDPTQNNRLALFVRANSSGARAGIWIDDDGNQKFVYIGTQGDPICILTENAIDFWRLLAIGHYDRGLSNDNHTVEEDYKGWSHDFELEKLIEPVEFRDWVEKTFSVKVPKRGVDLVKVPPAPLDECTSPDIFFKWFEKICNREP